MTEKQRNLLNLVVVILVALVAALWMAHGGCDRGVSDEAVGFHRCSETGEHRETCAMSMGVALHGEARPCRVRHGGAGQGLARQGGARTGEDRQGEVW